MRNIGIYRIILTVVCVSIIYFNFIYPNDGSSIVGFSKAKNSFTLSSSGKSVPLYANIDDFPGVIRAIKNLQTDIGKVTGSTPQLTIIPKGGKIISTAKEIVIIGTIGKSPLIDQLIKNNKISVKGISKKWETSLVQTVNNPFPKITRALVIAGSDKRGSIYGIYDLSRDIGVSPWYWWADVPVKKKSSIYITPGRFVQEGPKVKYRGFFINDEAPALKQFVNEKFGGFNSAFYIHVFELILRLKGNFLWPAMWDDSFFVDDTLNPKLADECGIVMSTSHHEPMMRAFIEWTRAGNKKGSWDYSKNAEALRKYWKEGIQRSKDYEEVVTLAMRGDGDEPMSENANIDLLQNIVKDQRKIIEEVTGKNAAATPQVWALYKEVQEYYDKGMRVPDDVTILMCDDNWGNIRKLPSLDDPPHPGGYGIYYHFDFVGGPRSYRWLNTNQIERVWEQMHLAYKYGVDKIWIVNVGDIKPMEFPLSFFLDYAWNPDKIQAKDLPDYVRKWAMEQFGSQYSVEIADILNSYTKFNSRCKPELLSPETYSLSNYREAERVVEDYYNVVNKAQQISNLLPSEFRDSFYQLVLHQPSACSNLNDLYVTAGKNHLYAKQGRSATNSLAKKARELFLKDSLITLHYNTKISGGKWNHMMDQTHIGYTNWQEPPRNKIPDLVEINIPEKAEMGVAVEGSEGWWPNQKIDAILPEFDVYNQQKYYFEIFNRGKTSFEYSIRTEKPWIKIFPEQGKIETEKRLWINIDWNNAPRGNNHSFFTIMGTDSTIVKVQIIINNPVTPKRSEVDGFVENDGYVSINAENYTSAIGTKNISWHEIQNLGRTSSAMTVMPVTSQSQKPGGESPRLEYKVNLFSKGDVRVDLFLSPTLNFNSNRGLRYAVSFDNEEPQIVNIHENDSVPDWRYPLWWNKEVSENIITKTTAHLINKPGEHILKFWMVDPGVVLQKIVIGCGKVRPSYLGPPESFKNAGRR